MKILIIILLILFILSMSSKLDEIKKNPHNLISKLREFFIVSIKDKQKIGTVELEYGKQPKSSVKKYNNGYYINDEICYNTETRKGNRTNKMGPWYAFCNKGIDGGEVIPSEGLYNLDFTNYNIYYGKALKGTPLTGQINMENGNAHFLSNEGIPINETPTLSQCKDICDRMKDKCVGFISVIPAKDTFNSKTIFLSKLEKGFEDPNTYSKILGSDIISTNVVSYVKKDIDYIEKPVSNTLFSKTSEKHKNLTTCNWKSAYGCIFKDYKYDENTEVCKNPSNKDQAYSTNELNNYNNQELLDWLKAKAIRDTGNDKLTSDEANVREYIDRCKEVDNFEFLTRVGLPDPYVPTTKPGDVTGRYVRITINNRDVTNNWLQLAEVQVISNNRNIAVGKSSNSSGNYPGSSNSKANDGNNDGNWYSGSVYHSGYENEGGPQFWEVDLGQAQIIDKIIVSNRTDCCGERLNNWLLSIYDNNKKLTWARIYTKYPNPRVILDIKGSENDKSNIRIKDYEQTRFNKFFNRISDTEFNSKRGNTNECKEDCHKQLCEGENKKWIGDSNFFACRDYKPGEKEAEEAEKRRIEEKKRKEEEERIRRESLKVTFSATFYQWQTPSHDVQASWVNFRRKLTGVYDTMYIANNLGHHFKVTDPRVNQLAHALREGRHGFRIDLGGKTWRVLTGCIVWSAWQTNDQVYLTTDPWDCSCGHPGTGQWTIRPMINNYNWGGGPGASNSYHSCWAQTQTMTLQFSNTLNIEQSPFISEINRAYNVDLIQSLFGGQRQLNLLYKATRDGWQGSDFHSRCDRKGATLTIIRTNDGLIGGGYTPVSWESRNNYVHVNNGEAFLFSVSRGNVRKGLNDRYPQYSMYDTQWHLPIFGGGHDLILHNNAHQSPHNYVNPWAYSNVNLFNHVNFGRFIPNEVEVYQVT